MTGRRLVVVRGWPPLADDAVTRLIRRIEAAGVEVGDVYVDPAGCSSMTEWAAASLAAVDALGPTEEPLCLLGYCLGGHVTIEVTALLTEAGRAPAHVALLDTWDRSPAYQLQHGTFRRYRISWRRRIRHQLLALTRPRPVLARTVARDWALALVRWIPRWVREVVVRRGEPRRRGSHWHALRLAYDWTYSALDVPVHLYNAEDSIRLNDGDATMGLAGNLRGGSLVRRIGGDHDTCLEPPNVERLVALIVADLANGR